MVTNYKQIAPLPEVQVVLDMDGWGSQAKKIGKLIRDEGPKNVKTQIQGDELRVTGKSRDDLQDVQKLLADAELDFAVQYQNYR